jgi:hypothetical protein
LPLQLPMPMLLPFLLSSRRDLLLPLFLFGHNNKTGAPSIAHLAMGGMQTVTRLLLLSLRLPLPLPLLLSSPRESAFLLFFPRQRTRRKKEKPRPQPGFFIETRQPTSLAAIPSLPPANPPPPSVSWR